MKAAFLTFYIRPRFIKYYTNNTIYATVYRYKRIYGGVNAQCELKFGAKGTNGTGYTLFLNMASEHTNDGSNLLNPPAWT
jgi:hypothetical protein